MKMIWFCVSFLLLAPVPYAAKPASFPAQLSRSMLVSSSMEIPWTRVDVFLPTRPSSANAAPLYAEATQIIRTMPNYPVLPATLDAFVKSDVLRQALGKAFEGSNCRSADFLSIYSYKNWEKNAAPDLPAALVLASALSHGATFFLQGNQPDKALASARAAVSMGEHYRAGAPNLAQALVGEQIIREGLLACRACFLKAGDHAKAQAAAKSLTDSANLASVLNARSAASAAIWQNPKVLVRALQDPEPLIRADALLLIEACLDTHSAERMASAKDTQMLATMLKTDAAAIRPLVEALQNDSNPMVSRFAQRTTQVFPGASSSAQIKASAIKVK